MICDAGGQYQGKPDADQILGQIDYLVDKWFPDRFIPSEKFKIQFVVCAPCVFSEQKTAQPDSRGVIQKADG